MKISKTWLQKYIDISDIETSVLSHSLTMAGLEVEAIEDESKIFENFIIAFVEEKVKHPNADKLSLCTVFTGKEKLKVVCGAPNVDAGQKIVLALAGAIVPNGGFEIKKAKIRGEESNGMICSQKELGLSEDHGGIWVLPETATVGQKFSEYIGKSDIVFEIGITPNRPDALSHIGIARDVAALFNKKVNIPEVSLDNSSDDIKKYAEVIVEDAVNCPRYSAKVICGVKVGPSPDWLKRSLEAIGLRSINNVVDVTNFIMHEAGQPLHAFNLEMVAGKKIIVKQAGDNKSFVTLDSKKRDISSDTLLICDGEKPVAVAGVMGGENSEVTSETKDVLIESAYFNPSSIRKTSKKLQLSTDASYRYERGIDYNNSLWAAERAASLMAEVAGGEIVKGFIDIYPNKIANKIVSVRTTRVEQILGYPVEAKQISEILSNLGFVLISENSGVVEVEVPGFRPDVEREIDLIEEIARIYGYDNIPTIHSMSIPVAQVYDENSFADLARDYWIGKGFSEIISNSFVKTLVEEEIPKAIAVLNPQSADMVDLRTSLLWGLLATVSRNISVGEKTLNLFEVGNIFIRKNQTIESFADFGENQMLGVIVTGSISQKEWYTAQEPYNLFHLKGLYESYFRKISLDNLLNHSYYPLGNNIFEYFTEISNKGNVLGRCGKVKNEVLEKYNIDQEIFYFEIELEHLGNIKTKSRKFSELLKYPKVHRDAAFVLDKNIESGTIEQYIKSLKIEILQEVRLFDLFESESLGASRKSLAYSFVFSNESRTLRDEEVEKEFLLIITKVKNEFNAELRQ